MKKRLKIATKFAQGFLNMSDSSFTNPETGEVTTKMTSKMMATFSLAYADELIKQEKETSKPKPKSDENIQSSFHHGNGR